jgi:hypothetical protein
MALIVKDRVQEISTTVGTGTLTLGGAVLGFQSFAAIGDGNTTYYAISDPVTGDWEVGIGTYTSSGTTLSRDTVLSSSTGASPVSFVAGTKNVFCTYPSERSVYRDALATYTVQQAFDAITANSIALTSGTISSDPVNATDIANKSYVDEVAEGLRAKPSVELATTANLTANYNNGTSGVGATLTATTNGAFPMIDGITLTSTTPGQNGVLVKNQSSALQNGRYNLTTLGDGSNPWVLTRCPLCDESDEIPGAYTFVKSGTLNGGTGWVQTVLDPSTFTIGVDAIIVVQFSGAGTYTAGTGLTLTSNVFSITNTAVTPASYGTASSVGTFTVNAQGQLTNAVDTPIAIGAAAVSGLAASATTDTTNASNISSGTLGTSRLSGSYTSITGVGALAAGSLASGFTAVTAPLGGTGQTSYAVGDLLFADTTTSLAKLADVAVGNALISGGVAAAPSYGKIGLDTHVSGTLPVANGGTGVTSSTGTGSVVLSTSPTLVTPLLGTPTSGNLANCTFPTLNQNTTGTAAGLSATLVATSGGTGQSSYAVGDLLFASTTTALSKLADIATGSALISGGVGVAPSYGKIGLTTHVSGTLPIANGGSGATTAQGGMNAFAGAVTSGQYLRGNGSNVVMSAIQAGDVPTLNQNTTGTAAGLSATLAVTSGGTGQTTYTNGQLLIGNTTGNTLTKAALTGTSNQIVVTNGAGSITLSTPQSIGTASSVRFGSFGVGTAASGTTGEIRATNNVTAYYSSDRNLKENIRDIPDALNKVCAIGGKLFDWTDDYIKQHGGEDGYFVQKADFGVIAQDVKPHLPEAVRTRGDGTLAVDYEKLCALAFAAIAELRAEVEALKKR